MRKGSGVVDLFMMLIIFTGILSIAGAVAKSTYLSNEGREIFAKRSLSQSYIEIAKNRCLKEGEGVWWLDENILNRYPVKVHIICRRNGSLYEAVVEVCDTKRCGYKRKAYTYADQQEN